MHFEKLASLARLTNRLGRAASLEEVYSASLDCLQESLGVERAAILLFDDNEIMSFVAWRGISDEYRRAVNGHTPWRPDTPNPEPVLVPDAEREPALASYADTFRSEGIRALGFFALTYRDRVIGKFMLYYATPHEFTSDETALANTIGGQIAFGVTRIITERALEAEHERLEAMVANVPGMVWETVGDFPNQQLTFVSDGIEGLIGYTLEESREPGFWQQIVVERIDGDMKSIAETALQQGVPARHQYKFRTRDGRIIWAEVRSAHKVVNGTLLSRGVTMDITERRRAEERSAFLAEASGMLSATLDYEQSLAQVAQLIVAKEGDWCVIDIVDGDEVTRVAAVHRDPAKAVTMAKLRDEFAPSKYEVGFGRRAIETNTPILIKEPTEQTNALMQASPAGPIFRELGCESAIIVPITIAGRAFGSIAILSANPAHRYDEDDLAIAVELGRRAGYAVDHARLYRAAQAANHAKDEFLATLSHELRTPMTAALGWASMLRLGDTPPDTFRLAVETIERSIRAQAKLIDDIFDVSRIVTGKLQLQMTPVDLPRVIQAAVEAIQPSISAKGLRLELAYDHGIEAVLGDSGRLQQVIWNLLSNAVKFTPPGGTIRIDVQRSANRQAEISIRDSGQGIPKRMLPLIFERFRQGDSSSTRAHSGLGLGLAIVKSIVELHGGTVTAESDGEGQGAAFTVALPFLQQEAPQDAAAPRAEANAVSLNGVMVLVVEDDEDTRIMMTKVLERSGASVVAVGSAAAAIEALHCHAPDLVVSDIAMPGEDGYTLMRKIREGAVASCRDIPAIAVSAFVRPEDRERILAVGFGAQLAKPVDPMVMLRAVQNLVAN